MTRSRLLLRLERNRSEKILVAADSNATRHFIRNVLRSHLYQIHEAADGEEALRILQEQPDFDLLITDHSMPGLSGFELTKVLRQKLKRHDLSILGLSADSKGSLSAQFIKHGADDFLRKPFCPEELTCRVMSTLERRELLATSCFIEKVGAPDERVVRDVARLAGEKVNYLSLLLVQNPKRQRGELRRGCRQRKEAQEALSA